MEGAARANPIFSANFSSRPARPNAARWLAQSSKRLIESKIGALGLGHGFKAFSDRIETPGGGMIIFRGMQYDPGAWYNSGS